MDGDADVLIRAHLGPDEAGTRISTANPRIILVSAHFSKELTTSVLWLNQRDMDITCIKLQPYRSENELYIEASQVIPMAAAGLHGSFAKPRTGGGRAKVLPATDL